MTTQQEAIFEAPAAHEASYYGNPEWEHPEGQPEWEHPEGHPYASTEWASNEGASNEGESPAGEWEWEQHEGQPEWEHPEGHPYASTEWASTEWESPEGEWEQHEGQPEWEHPEGHPYASTEWVSNEWESPESHPYASGEWENPEGEWEQHEGQPEWEQEYATEADPFFGRLKKLAKKAAGFAKRFAVPLVTRALGSMIPGAGPLVGLASSLISESESEASAMEAHLFGTNELHPEVSNTEVAHEAALTEVMAHEAMEAQTEGEAEAVLTGALPITITIMGGRRSLRPVIPILAQANGRLVRTLRRQGPAGRQLLSTVPAIQRRTIAGLRAAARRGQPITGPLAVQTMTAAARRVLGNPEQVQWALMRNRMLRRRLAPWYPSRRQGYWNHGSWSGGYPPYHPRRAYGYPSMRRRMPV